MLAAVIVLVLAYQYMVRPALQPARLVFLHMNGCGWCVRFMPTWDAFVTKHSGSLRMAGVEVQKIEGSDPSAAKYQVRSYPTVLLVKSDGTNVKFDGERTIEGLQRHHPLRSCQQQRPPHCLVCDPRHRRGRAAVFLVQRREQCGARE